MTTSSNDYYTGEEQNLYTLDLNGFEGIRYDLPPYRSYFDIENCHGMLIKDKYYTLSFSDNAGVTYVSLIEFNILDSSYRTTGDITSFSSQNASNKYVLMQTGENSISFVTLNDSNIKLHCISLLDMSGGTAILQTPVIDDGASERHTLITSFNIGKDVFLQFGNAVIDGHTHSEWFDTKTMSTKFHKEQPYTLSNYGQAPKLVAALVNGDIAKFVFIMFYGGEVVLSTLDTSTSQFNYGLSIHVFNSEETPPYYDNYLPLDTDSVIFSGSDIYFSCKYFDESKYSVIAGAFIHVNMDNYTYNRELDLDSLPSKFISHKNNIYSVTNNGKVIRYNHNLEERVVVHESDINNPVIGLIPVGNTLTLIRNPYLPSS